jgi:hypothetical protein
MAKRNKRSGFEDTIAKQLKGTGAKYEPFYIEYTPTKKRRYTPDFVLPNGVLIETKGRFSASDRTKHLYIQAQHPEYDIRFVFMRDNFLNKKSDTTYTEWATKHGFKSAVGAVPKEWLKEKQ